MGGIPEITEVADRVFLVDVKQFGLPKTGGVYVILQGEAALVDSGTSLSAPLVLAALEKLGVLKKAVRWVFLTHIHLDHAGGAGVLLPELPNALVVAHPRAVKHLVNPRKLVASTREATGERFPLYGEAVPIPAGRVLAAADGEGFAVGSQEVRVVETPGHAPHHLCFFLPAQGLLFVGDAVGLYLKGRLLPTTVPPSFDLEASLATLAKLEALAPKLLLFTHFGPGEPDLVQEYRELLRSWVERVRKYKDVPEEEAVSSVLAELQAEGWPMGPGVSGDWAMSVRGVLGYLRRKEAGG